MGGRWGRKRQEEKIDKAKYAIFHGKKTDKINFFGRSGITTVSIKTAAYRHPSTLAFKIIAPPPP
jgi:hypothetical protein